MLEDFFENITVYDNRATSASYEKLEDGRYAVRLNVEAKKYHADGGGTEREVALAGEIDVGIFGEDDKVLYLEKRLMDGEAGVIEVIVDEEPHEAGIDPYNKLIDRNPEDNVTRVTSSSGGYQDALRLALPKPLRAVRRDPSALLFHGR